MPPAERYRLVIVGGRHAGEMPGATVGLDQALDVARCTFDGLHARPGHGCQAVRILRLPSREVVLEISSYTGKETAHA